MRQTVDEADPTGSRTRAMAERFGGLQVRTRGGTKPSISCPSSKRRAASANSGHRPASARRFSLLIASSPDRATSCTGNPTGIGRLSGGRNFTNCATNTLCPLTECGTRPRPCRSARDLPPAIHEPRRGEVEQMVRPQTRERTRFVRRYSARGKALDHREPYSAPASECLVHPASEHDASAFVAVSLGNQAIANGRRRGRGATDPSELRFQCFDLGRKLGRSEHLTCHMGGGTTWPRVLVVSRSA
jgi:hypothetical protein